MTGPGRRAHSFATVTLIAAGIIIAAAGATLLYRTVKTADLIATAYGVRNGGLSLSEAELNATIARLAEAAGPQADADQEAALTFLHYASAQAAAARGDKGTWLRELLAARVGAREALALEPTRADVSLALAEI